MIAVTTMHGLTTRARSSPCSPSSANSTRCPACSRKKRSSFLMWGFLLHDQDERLVFDEARWRHPVSPCSEPPDGPRASSKDTYAIVPRPDRRRRAIEGNPPRPHASRAEPLPGTRHAGYTRFGLPRPQSLALAAAAGGSAEAPSASCRGSPRRSDVVARYVVVRRRDARGRVADVTACCERATGLSDPGHVRASPTDLNIVQSPAVLSIMNNKARNGEMAALAPYLQAARGLAPLSPEAQRALAIRARRGDAAARDELVRRHLPLVVAFARKQRRGTIRLEELVQEGNLGLLRAVEKYDPYAGTRFSTYARRWIPRLRLAPPEARAFGGAPEERDPLARRLLARQPDWRRRRARATSSGSRTRRRRRTPVRGGRGRTRGSAPRSRRSEAASARWAGTSSSRACSRIRPTRSSRLAGAGACRASGSARWSSQTKRFLQGYLGPARGGAEREAA